MACSLFERGLAGAPQNEDLIPYPPITTRDMIATTSLRSRGSRKLTAGLVNGFTRLIPYSRRASENKEHCLEWAAGRALSDTLEAALQGKACRFMRAGGALDRALFAVLGKKKVPALIESPMDARRGVCRLESDMLFFGGGSLEIPTGQALEWISGRGLARFTNKFAEILRRRCSIFRALSLLRNASALAGAQMQSVVRVETR